MQSEVLLLFSCARKACGETCADSLCRSLCSTKDARSFFFCREKEKRREEKNQKKKNNNHRKKRFKNPLKSLISPQIFRHASLFWKNWISSPVFVTTTNDTRRSKSTRDIYNKKELSIISRSNKMMIMMCVNCCVIHFSTFR